MSDGLRRTGGGRKLAAFFSLALAGSGLTGCRRPESRVRVIRESPSSPGSPDALERAAPPAAVVSFHPAEAAAIRAFLAAHPTLRVASDSDARPPEDADDVSRLYGVYHPYFVRGDIDDDGALDFVVAFVDKDRKSASVWFTVVAFCAQGDGFRAAQMIESEISLEQGDVSIDRDAIVITPDLGETDSSRRYRWNARQRRFDFVSDSDDEPDSVPGTRI